jgi:clan AA aspartic protease (TIGR02281 family)
MMTVPLVLDTGAVYTTITPQVAETVGYSGRDGLRRTRVRTAIGSEQGYVLATARFAVLGLIANEFPVHVFDLGHEISGLLGLNFLSLLNYEIRSIEHRILVEPVASPTA